MGDGALSTTGIPKTDEGLHVAVFSVTIFGEVDALTEGVILPLHDVAIPRPSLHIFFCPISL